MAALEIQYAVDLGDVDDGVAEQHNFHLLHLGLVVVGLQFAFKVSFQLIEADNFLVVGLFLRLQEVDEDCVVFASHAVVFVLALEVVLQLLVKNVHEFLPVLNRDETVGENAQDFVAP
jgi:hypothetical protein